MVGDLGFQSMPLPAILLMTEMGWVNDTAKEMARVYHGEEQKKQK